MLEQGFQRAGDDPKLLAFGPIVPELMESAAELAESTDYVRALTCAPRCARRTGRRRSSAWKSAVAERRAGARCGCGSVLPR